MDLEVRHLQMVSTVAAVGGLTKAGRHLNLSQSALSHQLRDVETRLGTPLFLRVGKRMVPTAAGERLVKSAQEILEALATAERAIHTFAGGERGRLRVRVAGYASYRWLPSVLTRYRALHANVDVQFPEPGASDAIGGVLDGSIDVAIGPGIVDDKHLHIDPLVRDEVVFAVAPGHRLAACAFVDPGDLGDAPLFVDASERSSAVHRQIVDAAGRTPGNLVMSDTAAALELVRAGLGIAIVGRWVIEPLIGAGALRAVRITRKGVSCCWSAAMLKHLADSAHVRDFVALVAREMSGGVRRA